MGICFSSSELEADYGDSLKIGKDKKKELKIKGNSATCKIITKDSNGSGFFCKINYQNKIFKCLLTNNHVLDKKSIEEGKTIKSSYKGNLKKFEIKNRKCHTNEDLDYTYVEIFDYDEIEDFLEIANERNPNYDEEYKNDDVAILQYSKGGPLSIEGGRLKEIKNDSIYHTIPTYKGSSGSPIILLLRQYKVIGIHSRTIKKKQINAGPFINSVISDLIKNNILYVPNETNITKNSFDFNKNQEHNNENFYENYILCTYNILEKNLNNHIQILNCLNKKTEIEIEKDNKINQNQLQINEKEIKNYCELFLNNKKINFCLQHKFNKKGENTLKIQFNKVLENSSLLFFKCSLLSSLDFSHFDSSKITKMNYLFSECSSLESLNLFDFNTMNVTDMSYMFTKCHSLIELKVSNFKTNNVIDMKNMFQFCSSLVELDLSNFNTSNVIDMSWMFNLCSSLRTLNINNFNTIKVKYMIGMFNKCSSLISLNIPNFKTKNVISMKNMFSECSSLKSLDLSNFNTINVTDMSKMFYLCTSLSFLNICNFNTNKVEKKDKMFCNYSKKCIVKVDDPIIKELLNK